MLVPSTVAAAVVVAILTTFIPAVSIETSADATMLEKDPSASDLIPKEEPKRPSWDSNGAPGNATGQEAEGQHCIGCVKDLAPDQEGLKEGITGPD